MKHAAATEIQKARGETPKKFFTEMCMVRSFRNQIFDRVQHWKNWFTFLGNAGKTGPL